MTATSARAQPRWTSDAYALRKYVTTCLPAWW